LAYVTKLQGHREIIGMNKDLMLTQLDRSYHKLLEALEIPASQPLAIDATIKRFECTYKIACETIHTFYEDRLDARRSQRKCVQEAIKEGLIEDQDTWMVLIMSKNLASFPYSEQLSLDVYDTVKKHHRAFNSLISSCKDLVH